MTEEQITSLREMWAAGDSMGVIGQTLGLSRNTIAGHIFRNGLQRGEKKLPTQALAGWQRPFNAQDMKDLPTRRRYHRRNIIAITPQPNIVILITQRLVNFFDLEKHHCRWAVDGEGLAAVFCGADKANNSSYCAAHFHESLSQRNRRARGDTTFVLREPAGLLPHDPGLAGSFHSEAAE